MAKSAKTVVAGVLAAAAAQAAVIQTDRLDHDSLTRLEVHVATLTQQAGSIATDAAVRSTRIEEKVTAGFERINGSIGRHELSIRDLTARPPAALTLNEAKVAIDRLDRLWDIYRLGRWLLAAFMIAQPLEIFALHFWK